ncbi:MAG: hypothetical protein WCF17_19620 [Terracidiphilus sp.]
MLLKPQSIQVQGTQQYTPSEIGQAAGAKVGQTYTADALSQTAQNLMATGMFARVGFKFDGQALVYLVTDSPDLYPVTIDNLPLPPGQDIDSILRAKVPLYRGKVPSEGAVLDGVRQALQAMLAQEGVQAAVVCVPAGDDPGKKATAMNFRINSPAVRVGPIQLQGVAPDLQTRIPTPTLLTTSEYKADGSAAHIQRFYETALANLGYAAANVRVRRAGNLQFTVDAIGVPFAVDVTPGRIYKLGEVRIAPDVPVTMKQLESTAKPRSGYSPENSYVSAVVAEVTLRLKSMGYLDCKVDTLPQVDESSGTVNYSIDAFIGPVYHLAFVKFLNVSDQLRILLMRNWQMTPGDPFDETYVGRFILNAQKSDPVLARSLAGVKATYEVKADPQTHDVNLTVRLER